MLNAVVQDWLAKPSRLKVFCVPLSFFPLTQKPTFLDRTLATLNQHLKGVTIRSGLSQWLKKATVCSTAAFLLSSVHFGARMPDVAGKTSRPGWSDAAL